jgi:uncharacterized RDD family membrane protein YckC
MTVGMTYPVSIPPPGAPEPEFKPAPPPPPQPVTGLKQYDGKRVLARVIDWLVVGLPAGVVNATYGEAGVYWLVMAFSLIYFFLCEAAFAQTIGKRVMGLRVMTRYGDAPSLQAVSARTVLRLIDDSPIGLIVMVASGQRRQRIGDMLAGTTVGGVEFDVVPRPAVGPLIVIYPVAWLIGAFAWITLTPATASAGDYVQQATEICQIAAAVDEPDAAGWVPLLEEMHRRHAALTPPPDLADVHTALVQSDAAMVDTVRQIAAAGNDQAALQRIVPTQLRIVQEREAKVGPELPGCV